MSVKYKDMSFNYEEMSFSNKYKYTYIYIYMFHIYIYIYVYTQTRATGPRLTPPRPSEHPIIISGSVIMINFSYYLYNNALC